MDIRFLFGVALIMVLLEWLVYRLWALSGVQYRRFFSASTIYAGDAVEMVEVLENAKLLPLPWVMLESSMDGSIEYAASQDANVSRTKRLLHSRSYFSLRSYMRVTRRHHVQFHSRGIFSLNTAAMTCGDLFGMHVRFKQWVLSGAGSHLVVFPRLVPYGEFQLPTHTWQGDILVRRFILPDPFARAGARPYQYGDPLHQVNWSATARTGQLHVHQQEYSADLRVLILLNAEISEEMWENITEPLRMEAAISLAATVAVEATSHGGEVGFATNVASVHPDSEINIPIGQGDEHLELILTAMSGLQMRVQKSFMKILQTEQEAFNQPTDYLVITGYVNDAMTDAFEQLRQAGHFVHVVSLPSVEQAEAWLNVSSTNSASEREEAKQHA